MQNSWISRLLPAATNTRPTEWSRAAIGVSLGTLLSVWICSLFFGLPVAMHLIGPLGASAILLFAVSSGALAQPWSIVGGYLCATVVSLGVVHFFGRNLDSACLAVGLAMLIMCLLRCLHPPAGALALLVVLADPDSARLGWGMLAPVMLSAVCMLLAALVYNNLTRVRYPKKNAEPAPAIVAPHIPGEAGITAEDLQKAMEQMDAFIDVTPEDLEALVRASEHYARRRSVREVFAESA
ncbi:HPP family protein [Pseudomonas helleri]|uniref:HPP family protein n=1 Tax=Pseudomonas helleri TaxID=1608996 RepID=A0A6L5HWJ1_9PSED|nr:HPP family protein [Pseudomonas helleri]MCU1757090.1 HPP family protein [Pseudomonas helleri]MQU07762.1 HPP family protein [Pseudomonas helleri]